MRIVIDNEYRTYAIQGLDGEAGLNQQVVSVCVGACWQTRFKNDMVADITMGASVLIGDGDCHVIILTMNGDGQCGGGSVAVRISDGVGIDLGEGLANLQALYIEVSVVQLVAVVTIFIQN